MLSSLHPLVYQPHYPGSSDGKESDCNVGDLGSISGSRRSPGEGNGKPLMYSCLGNPVDRGAWLAVGLWGSQRVRHNLVTETTKKCLNEAAGG